MFERCFLLPSGCRSFTVRVEVKPWRVGSRVDGWFVKWVCLDIWDPSMLLGFPFILHILKSSLPGKYERPLILLCTEQGEVGVVEGRVQTFTQSFSPHSTLQGPNPGRALPQQPLPGCQRQEPRARPSCWTSYHGNALELTVVDPSCLPFLYSIRLARCPAFMSVSQA